MNETSKATVCFKLNFSASLLQTPSVQWSSNNQIAFITTKGIYVLTIVQKATRSENSAVHKFIIENPSETLKFDIHAAVKDMMQSMPNKEQHRVIMDHTILPETDNESLFRVFRQAMWSPVIRKYGCVLATITVDHRIQLFIEKSSSWVLLVDLSNFVFDCIDGANKIREQIEVVSKHPMYASLRDLLYKAMVNCIAWTQMYKSETKDVCYLVCASKSGYFTVFKFTFDEVIDFSVGSVEFVADWHSGLGLVTSVTWYRNFLIIATNGGQLQVLRPIVNFDTFNLEMAPRVNPWIEKDDISINHLVMNSLNSNSFWIAFTKGLFIIVAKINEISIAKKAILVLDVVTTKEAIYKMPASAMCLTSSNTFLISSLDGRLISAKVLPDCTIVQKELKFDIPLTNRCIYGLNPSPNMAMVCMAQTLVTYHDHLEITEPTQITLFSSYSFNSVVEYLTNHLNNNSFQSAKSLEDVMCCFLSYLQSGHSWFPPQLLNVESVKEFCKEDRTNSCKLLRFIAVCLTRNCSLYFNEEKMNDLETLIKIIEDHITTIHVKQILNGFSNLTATQKHSLLNFNSWLRVQCATVTKMDPAGPNEVCPICELEVEFKSRVEDSCPNGHRFSRCCSSLLLCDLLKNRVLTCKTCNRSCYIVPPVWNTVRECLFCS